MAMRTFMNRSDTAPCRAGRLRAALSFTAAVAVAAALGGCSTFGVSPFPEPIRPPIEAEGEDTAAPEAQAEEAGRYSPTPGVRITRTQARGVADELGADLEGPPIEAAFNGVTIREQDGVLTFLATQEIESGEVPLLISGRTLPEVPATHRTVFQLVPLQVVPVKS